MKTLSLVTISAALLGMSFTAGCKEDSKPLPTFAAAKDSPKVKGHAGATTKVETPAKAKPADDWVAFESKEGRFAARFPVSPQRQKVPVPTTAGTFTQTVFSAQKGLPYFAVAVIDYPPKLVEQRGTANMLDGVRDGATRSGKIISEKKFTLQGWPARRLQVKGFHGRSANRDLIIVLANARLYQAIVAAPVGTASTIAKRFLTNFKPVAKKVAEADRPR
jgi:hypothetical protein